jgi:hypothetical protein
MAVVGNFIDQSDVKQLDKLAFAFLPAFVYGCNPGDSTRKMK